MFFRKYPERQFKPECSGSHTWNVWCASGALEVLEYKEYIRYLKEQPDSMYSINFANGAYADISPGHPLWQALKAVIEEGYQIEVGKVTITGGCVPWTGDETSLRRIDAIIIGRKKDAVTNFEPGYFPQQTITVDADFEVIDMDGGFIEKPARVTKEAGIYTLVPADNPLSKTGGVWYVIKGTKHGLPILEWCKVAPDFLNQREEQYERHTKLE